MEVNTPSKVKFYLIEKILLNCFHQNYWLMKKRILLTVGIIIAIIVGYIVFTLSTTKNHSPEAMANYSKNGLTVNVKYCRPYKKGRLLFGEPGSTALEFYGQPWRTGANEATEIEFNQDIKFPEGKLAAGRYSLYSIPGDTEWILAFNSKLGYWGASLSGSPFESDLDVLRVKIPRKSNDKIVEQLTISFSDQEGDVKMLLLWDDIKVEVPMNVAG